MSNVASVTSVCFHLNKSNPPELVVSASGTVGSSGWKDFRLFPVTYIVQPPDGIQDFEFEGTPPTGMALQVIRHISGDGSMPLELWMKGVRVHGANNSVVAMFDDAACAVEQVSFDGESGVTETDGPKDPTLPGGNGGH